MSSRSLFGFSTIGLILILSFGTFKAFGAVLPSVSEDNTKLENLLAEYVNWNVNVPTEQLPEEGNQCTIKAGAVILLLDPFSKGTVVQTCKIKSGSS